MKKKVIIISLGGSLIVPDNVNFNFLKKFKKSILKNTKKYKFIIVCGGGSIARKYIYVLKKENVSSRLQSYSGISATRMNARFMTYFFNKDSKYGIPHDYKSLKKYLKNHDVIFIGALKYKPKQTSDSTAADLSKKFRTIFINLTDVAGLYDKNPKKYKNAKFISRISWKKFYKIINAKKYQPGQHFVLDQTASKIIMKYKIPTYILGQDIKQLDSVLKGKEFKGTLIKG